jgi:hypothetical protein
VSRDDPTKRRYSEEEFALILRKASEIQESPRGEGGKSTGAGLSLEEIQSIAREAGIDPQAVWKAAALLGTEEWEEKRGLASMIFGAPGTYHLDFEVPGRLPPEEMGRLLELIRREAAHQGEASEVLGGVEWKTVGEVSAINVNLTPRGDSTSIQIVGDRGGAGALSFIFPVAASAILVGALGAAFEPTSAGGIVSLVGGLLGSGFLVGRTIFVTGSRRFHKKLTRLMSALSGEVERVSIPPFNLPEGEVVEGEGEE